MSFHQGQGNNDQAADQTQNQQPGDAAPNVADATPSVTDDRAPNPRPRERRRDGVRLAPLNPVGVPPVQPVVQPAPVGNAVPNAQAPDANRRNRRDAVRLTPQDVAAIQQARPIVPAPIGNQPPNQPPNQLGQAPPNPGLNVPPPRNVPPQPGGPAQPQAVPVPGNVPPALPQNPAPVRLPTAPDMQFYSQKSLADVDMVGLKMRRWSVSTLAAIGLNSNSSQDRTMASTIATAARIDESSCQPGVGPHCAAALKTNFNQGQLDADPPFKGLVNALETFENSSRIANAKKARGTAEIAPLRQAAAAFDQSLQGQNNLDANKLAALAEIKNVVRAFDLRDQVIGYGTPPWSGQAAKQATKAKVELDILSMPAGSRAPQPPPGAVGGVNTKFWIKRSAGTGQDQDSFICKPAGASPVDGIPDGGETAREGLVHRAGAILGAKLNIQLNIPETHSISLDNTMVLPGQQNQNGTSTACSVQELRPNEGPAAGRSKQQLAQASKNQVHGLIALDICTLNLDRHSGNLLLDGANLIPIDHGSSLPDPVSNKGTNGENNRGLRRIRDAMGSSHNVMLKFPQAHEPMDEAMRKDLVKLSPKAVRNELSLERQAIVQELQAADNTLDDTVLSDDALNTSRRAMEFMHLAADKFKNLSPASMQLALAKNATVLLDPKVSEKNVEALSKKVLAEALHNQEVAKQACLMNPVEHKAMKAALAAAGWPVPGQGAPGASVLCDPALALKLAMGGIRAPAPVQQPNAPKLPAPVAAKGAPDAKEKALLEAEYPRLANATQIARLQIDLSEEWAAHKALEQIKAKSPEAYEEFRTFALMLSDKVIQQPTAIMRGIQEIGQIKATLAASERHSSALSAISNQLVAFKFGIAQGLVVLLRGPLNQQFSQALISAQAQGLDAVTAVGDLVLERVRTGQRRETANLLAANTITAQEAKTIEDLIASSEVAAADQLLAAIPNYARPNTV